MLKRYNGCFVVFSKSRRHLVGFIETSTWLTENHKIVRLWCWPPKQARQDPRSNTIKLWAVGCNPTISLSTNTIPLNNKGETCPKKNLPVIDLLNHSLPHSVQDRPTKLSALLKLLGALHRPYSCSQCSKSWELLHNLLLQKERIHNSQLTSSGSQHITGTARG
jgi:hypothetical protein